MVLLLRPPPSTHTKKQIINKTCNNIFGFEITLNIAAKYYPIEVKWDSSLFISALDSCHAGSLFTTYDYYQNDVGSGFAFFANQDSLILYEDPGFPFYDDDTLKINLHWISFSKEQELSVEEVDENRNNLFSLYPNPTGGNFFIHIEGSDLIDPVIMVTDLSGKIVKEMSLSSDMTKCELGTIQDGMYLVHILSDGKVIETQKLIYAK
ncbi:MAG: T9SS type A sorting domain-containing protein [Bacteroidota bacterium]